MKLNCDLGESFGSWTIGMDQAVMPQIDMANIACGFHAGDPLVMQKTLALAIANDVTIGAHPGYPDLVGFGRRSLNCCEAEIISMVQYQIAALDGMARIKGAQVSYVKPHGALYNDMMAKPLVRQAIMQAVADYHCPLVLMLQATPQWQEHKEEAQKLGLDLYFEAFADRCYDDDGKLVSRTLAGAVHDHDKMLDQVKQLVGEGTITSVGGRTLSLQVDSLCVHGDNAVGVAAIADIRQCLSGG